MRERGRFLCSLLFPRRFSSEAEEQRNDKGYVLAAPREAYRISAHSSDFCFRFFELQINKKNLKTFHLTIPTPTPKKQKRIKRTHAVAGCVAGLASTLALQPLDVVKTRLQVQDGVARSLGAATSYRGTAHALASIARSEGWAALYAGLAPALLGAGLSWGCYFAAYSAAKERWAGRLGGAGGGGGGSPCPSPFPPSPGASSSCSSSPSSSTFSLPAAAHMAAAAEAGALVALLTNPVWVVKTRLQLQARGGMAPAAARGGSAAGAAPPPAAAPPAPAAAAARTAAPAAPAAAPAARAAAPPRPPRPPLRRYGGGVRGTVRAIVAEEGVRGLYRGLLPSLLLVSHGAIQFAVYEELKALARSHGLFLLAEGGGGGGGGSGASGGFCASAGPPPLASLAVAAAGAASKVAACVATYPAQVLRARLQQKQLPASVAAAAATAAGKSGAAVAHPPPAASASAAVVRYDRLASAFRTILAREGWGGFYKGLSPTLLRVVPQSALTFVAYERVLTLLQAAVAAAAARAKAREG